MIRTRPLFRALALGVVSTLASCAFRPSIEPTATPPRAVFAPADIARGAQLAAIGNCGTCHTSTSGRAYAGGRRIATPFGAIYSTNITPDRDTGIGRWSERAFTRAMREGIDREGEFLYPVFPYDHFALVGDADLHALYAFLMTRTPVSATSPPNELAFPFGFRPLLAAWQLLNPPRRRFVADPARGDGWNRGKYLVEGLAHCGACHTPRNAMGGEERDRAFQGGEAEGWIAPALDASSPAAARWTKARLERYLRNHAPPDAGIPAGPMLPFVHDLATAPADDVADIATYMASIAGTGNDEAKATASRVAAARSPRAVTNDAGLRRGGDLYRAACATCHDAGRGVGSARAMPLRDSTALALSSPVNLLRIVQDGVAPRDGEPGRFMPAFRGTFTADQLADLARYLRVSFGRGGAWADLDDDVRAVASGRSEG